ncbi:MAG: MFS transporter [Ardenticatenia bacterium]|nr:MFS transporter [Ardenticatenia bacterium]
MARKASLADTLRAAWANVPFRFAVVLYMLNWVTFDLVALMLPYYLLYWVAQGNLVTQVSLVGVNLAIGSAVLGVLLVTAVVALPVWNALAHRWGKREAYIVGMTFWAAVQVALYLVPQGGCKWC